MKLRIITLAALAVLVGVAPASAGFDDSNANSIIYWSPNDLSSTLITAAPGETVTMFALVNNNNGNYGHDQGAGYAPNWAPAIGYHIGAWWDTDAVTGSSFNWDNGPAYSGFNGQGDPVDITDKMYDRFAAVNWGEWNMFHDEVSRYDHYAAWQVQSNRGVWVGGYHPYEYIYENSIVTSFQFTVRSDIFDVAAYTWGTDELGNPIKIYESAIGLEFAAWNVYEDPELLSGWYNHYDAMTLRVTAPGTPDALGDFDGDGDVDADDVDILCANMGGDPATYDLDEDGDVDEDDMVYHVETLVEYDTDGDGTADGNGTYLGDFNLDGVVNATDLQLMKGTFGTSGVGYAAGNANCDTVVNATDLQILKGTFGSAVAGGVPEPASAALLLVAGAALARRRRTAA